MNVLQFSHFTGRVEVLGPNQYASSPLVREPQGLRAVALGLDGLTPLTIMCFRPNKLTAQLSTGCSRSQSQNSFTDEGEGNTRPSSRKPSLVPINQDTVR